MADASFSSLLPAPAAVAGRWSRRSLLVLLGITALATVARLWGLRSWAWNDAEAATWRALALPLAGADGFFAAPESQAPLVHLLLRGLVRLGVLPSLGEGALRLPFAFAGIVTVPLLALVGRRRVGVPSALFAAALLALHPTHVCASQTASPTVVALPWLLLVAAATEQRRWWWGTAAVVMAGLCDPVGWTGVLLLASPWLRGRVRRGAVVLTALAGGWLVLVACGDLRWPLLLLAAFAVVAQVPAPGLVAWSAAPAAAVCFAPAAAALATLPGLALLAATGALAATDRWLGARPTRPSRLRASDAFLVAVVVVLGLATDTFLQATLYQGARPPWRAAARVVLGAGEQSVDLLLGADAGLDVLTCYLRPQHWRQPGADPHPRVQLRRLRPEPLAPDLQELLAEAMRRGIGCFVVLRGDERQRAHAEPAAAALLTGDFVLAQVLAGPTADRDESLYVYRRRSVP